MPDDPSLYLIGDSILDNSFWPENGNSKHRVSRNCTGNLLTENMPGIVKDLSTEEIATRDLKISIKLIKSIKNPAKTPLN